MPTGYEVHMYHHIEQIAQHLGRIANCMEAAEKRAREAEERHNGPVYAPGVVEAFADELFGKYTTPEDIEAMAPAMKAVRRGFDAMEQAIAKQKEGPDATD